MTSRPILYSFRRCPYAMRARMVLHYSAVEYDLREVDLKNKPQSLIKASPKATVPVLILSSGDIIDESLDIMKYALSQNDSEQIINAAVAKEVEQLIEANDTSFVKLLRQYKYPDRYENVDPITIRKQAEELFLSGYEQMLDESDYLLGEKSLADYAILPFIRQFAYVDQQWFFESKYKNLIKWLLGFIETPIFEEEIMRKHEVWQD